ncbi:5-methylcytosine-specific restriction protein A [Microbacterium sp. BK668]|nr:5-methylcytosine-specific restriction protein A [Microbacterium sp. BK668]
MLAALNSAMGSLRRHVEAVHASVAAEVARASRVELGNAGLAKQQGFRSPTSMIAAATGTNVGDAARLVAVGEATAPRMTLTGADAPPKHAEVAAGLQSGRLSVAAAGAIIALLDRTALRGDPHAVHEAERVLVGQAEGLPMDQLRKILARAEAWLDPDGVQPREDELRATAYVHVREDRDGSILLDARLDPERGAVVKTVIDAMVGEVLRRRDEGPRGGMSADEQRPIPQLRADALATICRHALACESKDVPTGGATVVIRIGLDQLESGIGLGTIDGVSQPVSVQTIRRMAADAQVIPCVLGADSEILDFGRAKRLFTASQKLALGERDGGCAGCGLPPGMTQVHHLRWWHRDAGPTDLDNGILLCTRCHHRVHDDGWEIRIEGPGVRAKVWFIPPVRVDPARTPRLGGRARYDYALSA